MYAEKIKKKCFINAKNAFKKSCPFYSEVGICDNSERTHILCDANEDECDSLKYFEDMLNGEADN